MVFIFTARKQTLCKTLRFSCGKQRSTKRQPVAVSTDCPSTVLGNGTSGKLGSTDVTAGIVLPVGPCAHKEETQTVTCWHVRHSSCNKNFRNTLEMPRRGPAMGPQLWEPPPQPLPTPKQKFVKAGLRLAASRLSQLIQFPCPHRFHPHPTVFCLSFPRVS